MDHNSFGRNQRPKKACIKQALKFMLLLVICAWLLYQADQSRENQTERFDGEIKMFEEHGIVLLGRKGNPSSWLHQTPLPTSGNLHFVAESENATKDSFKSQSDQKEQGNEKYSNNDSQFSEEDKVDGDYSFHDENGVPHEGDENETRLGEMNTNEVVTHGDIEDAEINSGSITHADTSGIINYNLETSSGETSVL